MNLLRDFKKRFKSILKNTANVMELSREQKIEELLGRGVAEVIDREHLKARLLKGEKLRVKLGIDPTSPNIHLGRSVPLLKLRDFQDLGCEVVFIVGDFTGQIGDTSDKESERPMLSEQDVRKNMESYFEQAAKILDKASMEIRYNSEWLNGLSFQKVGILADAFSVAEFTARENIKKRLESGKRVSLREMLYPLMQGYDSIMVQADVELGGTDQRFNLLAGRTLQPKFGQVSQDILMTNLILGTDGRKMSSSWGNTINLTDAPNEMFRKVARDIDDKLIFEYFIHCTRVPLEEIKEMELVVKEGGNPLEAKLHLAEEITRLYHGENLAKNAREHYEIISKGGMPDDIRPSEAPPESTLVDLIVHVGYAKSRSDARRKIEQGAVRIDGVVMTDWKMTLNESYIGKKLTVGKEDPVEITFR